MKLLSIVSVNVLLVALHAVPTHAMLGRIMASARLLPTTVRSGLHYPCMTPTRQLSFSPNCTQDHKNDPVFLAAVLRGDRSEINAAFQEDPDLYYVDRRGRTPLLAAIEQKDPEALRLILSKIDSDRFNTMHGHQSKHPFAEAARIYKETAEDMHNCLFNDKGFSEKGPVHKLFERKIINAVDDIAEIVRILLEDKAFPSYFREETNPLHIAAQYAYSCDDTYAYEQLSFEILAALRISKPKLLSSFLAAQDSKKYTPLHYAAESGNASLVKEFIDCGAPLSNDSDKTPLYLACKRGHLEVVMELTLYNKKVNIAAKPSGKTPLHAACFSGNSRLIEYLIEICGANIKAVDALGRQPAYYLRHNPSPEALQLLDTEK